MSVLALPPLPDASSSSNSAATTATSTFQLPVVLPPSDQFVGYTILARSRKGLFDAALRETLLGKPIKFNAPKFASTESKTERSFKSTGGLNFELISDAYKLFSVLRDSALVTRRLTHTIR